MKSVAYFVVILYFWFDSRTFVYKYSKFGSIDCNVVRITHLFLILNYFNFSIFSFIFATQHCHFRFLLLNSRNIFILVLSINWLLCVLYTLWSTKLWNDLVLSVLFFLSTCSLQTFCVTKQHFEHHYLVTRLISKTNLTKKKLRGWHFTNYRYKARSKLDSI